MTPTSYIIGVGSLASGLILTFCNAFLFIGCLKNQKHFFIPWIVITMIILVCVYLIIAFLVIIGTISLVTSVSDNQKGSISVNISPNNVYITGSFEEFAPSYIAWYLRNFIQDKTKFNKEEVTAIMSTAGITSFVAAFILLVVTST